ncbi:hydantoinase/oxoprolinase family protein [Chelativorans sp. AA-79]|uniref:hydantoinase/oxoprolinase family protein n=1 Tax=Chelativorans sp. AA-79 TaxID=3028735 RepID=UPI0023F8CCA1|nr:hydantoinase/oxoprolinase family protein [Chelativorans sp. AA-79]WEX10776.1 hydantoinase/oxoprolinase family protein [Chelativorans sp. AA-79]
MNIVGVDIGGTFTDLVGYVGGHIVTSKTSTVPADPTKGIATSLDLAGCETGSVDELLHGSTIAINTVLERKGARTALLTTTGFRDVYAIGRSNRIEAFNLFFERPVPLVPRDLTFEVRERILATGEVLEPLDEKTLDEAVAWVDGMGVEAVAVCLLHAYVNPEHERRIGAALRQRRPDLFITLSHEILREYREYERTSTTVLNAFVGPRVGGYLRRLDGYLRDASFGGKVHIMRSNGGVMSLRLAQEQPVSMMESGPVAGMIGAGRLSKLLGLERCVGFDMGGTTAKSSLLTGGAPVIETGYVIGDKATGQPMQLPVVDIVEVGAGGGSIAWVDKTGGLHVGPQSVGADPGPACYGKGSADPVVTDADLLLGRINPRRFLNGGMALDVEAARRAMQEKVAGPLALSVPQAAHGVVRIADASMSLSVRAVSVNKGVDPRDTAMIAFGGAGPLHAISIAREIFIPTVVIPKLPGTFSALGMLMASWRQDFVQTLIGRVGDLQASHVEEVFAELAAAGQDQLTRDGIDPATADFHYYADLRYVGQEHAISIPVESAALLTGEARTVRDRFDREHDKRYGQSAPSETMEVVSLRLVLTAARSDSLAEQWLSQPWTPDSDAVTEHRDVVFDDPERPLKTQILWRNALKAGARIVGPAVIEEPNSTILIRPDDEVRVTEAGHLVVTLKY